MADSLDEYMTKYGSLLGQQAQELLQPLHNPKTEPNHQVIRTLKRKPYPPQAATITGGAKLLNHDKSLFLVGECGVGKAQPNDCRVLTNTGWKPIGELAVGDMLVDPTGEWTKVIGVYPQGMKDVYRVTFSDGASTRCCDEHLWAVQTPEMRWRGKPYKVMQFAEIRRSYRGKHVRSDGETNRRYFIPLAKRVDHVAKRLPLDAYLLGLLIGNGGFTTGIPSFSSCHTDIVRSVNHLLPRGLRLVRRDNHDYAVSGGKRFGKTNPVTAALRELDLMGKMAEEKFIPECYLTGTRHEERLSLLNGILDLGGSPSNGGVDITTSSPQLAKDIQALVWSLGGTAKIGIKKAPKFRYRGKVKVGKDAFRLWIVLPKGINPFRVPRKRKAFKCGKKYGPCRSIVDVRKLQRARCTCIAVDSPSRLYVTDDYIVTHNTLMGQGIVHCHAEGRPYRALVFTPGQLTSKWRRELLDTLPGIYVKIIESGSDLLPLKDYGPAVCPEWYIIGRDRAKLGWGWKAAYHERTIDFDTQTAEGEVVSQRGTMLFCPACGSQIRKKTEKDQIGKPVDAATLNKRKHRCEAVVPTWADPADESKPQERVCDEPLWQAIPKPRRFAPATYVHKQLPHFFDYLIIDEVHEEKGADSAQANAIGELAAVSKRVLALTGTLIGGYAEHMRPLLFRLSPQTLRAEGFKWQDGMPFNEKYGRIETVIRESSGGDDNRQSRGSSKTKTKYCRPGIMPTLFGAHLLGNSVFLGLQEMEQALPTLKEFVMPVPMDPQIKFAYDMTESALHAVVRQMLARHDKRLLGTMLNVLLGYPDHPYGWGEIGYMDNGLFVHVVTPPNLDAETIRPKEKALLDICRTEFDLGRQVWVYVQLNGKRNVEGRVARLVEKAGFKVKVLKQDVPLAEREDWIDANCQDVDVVISHPRLVETGLDLFSKSYLGHNFCTLVFYETGYVLPTMRQASRRAWRLMQPKECKVYYLYYEKTMQARAMELMGKKLLAAEALEGKFSSEGLVALAGDDGMEMAMAKALAENMAHDDSWQRSLSSQDGAGKKPQRRAVEAGVIE